MELKKRLDYIDIAKGLAMICIVLGHLSLVSVNRIVFTFHIPIFAVLSGYFVSEKGTIVAYLNKRVKSLLLPYYVTSAILILLSVLLSLIIDKGSKQWIFEAINWLFAAIYGAGTTSYTMGIYIPQIGAIWFLWATFWGNLFLRILIKQKREVRVICVFGLFFLAVLTNKYIYLPLSIQPGCCLMFYMYIGWLIRQFKEQYKDITNEIKIAFSVVCFLVWISFISSFETFWLVVSDVGRGWMDIIGSLCACWCVIVISKAISRYLKVIVKPLSYMGRNSVIMLCMHIIELNIFPWELLDSATGLSGVQKILLKIVLKFTWIIVMTILIEKNNVLRKLFGYGQKE